MDNDYKSTDNNNISDDFNVIISDRCQNILKGYTRCKIDFMSVKKENIKLREINMKLEVELKETRELERSHREHLVTSREMIGKLQEMVSQLVYLKRDDMKLKDEIASKYATIAAAEIEKGNTLKKNEQLVAELRNTHERALEELETAYKKNMNVVLMDSEEKIQRGAYQITQLQEQLSRQAAQADANIGAYRRRLEELEEKLKQSQFKQYLAQSSYASQYENQVERPYSAKRVPSKDACAAVDVGPVLGNANMKPPITPMPNPAINRTPTQANTLQVILVDNL